MTKSDHLSLAEVDEERADNQEKRQYWRKIRRRLLGICTVVLLIGILWQLGDNTRVPQIVPQSPSNPELTAITPDEALLAAADDLSQTEDFIITTVSLAAVAILPTATMALTEESSPQLTVPLISTITAEPKLSVESATESLAESTAESTTESATESTTESAAESTAESVVESTTESAAESTAESVAESLAESTTESAAESTAESAESAAESTAESAESAAEHDLTPSAYEVQIGSFEQKKAAVNLLETLRALKYKSRLNETYRGKVLFFQVRVTGYQTRAAAEIARRALIDLGYAGAYIYDNR